MHAGTVETPLKHRWSLRSLTPERVSEVRGEVMRLLTEWGYETDEPVLVVAELVANVVRHATGRGVLTLSVREDDLLVTVGDKSPCLPEMLEPDFLSDCGRGIYLVDQLSRSWGSQATKSGKFVWAQLKVAPLSPKCYRCAVLVQSDRTGIIAGRILQRGKPDLPLVYCPACSQELIDERTGCGALRKRSKCRTLALT
ncbi:ATP-binding protein [Streptomyces sp. NPDC005551]|uniref:ATP-binding protein n=1 Tax=Streptomyces sp. NPDC005551 TaxID=3364725 RepID=UPI0036A23644